MVDDVIKNLNLNKETPTAWTEEQLKTIAQELRKRTKPMLIAANKVDIPGADKNFERVKAMFKEYIVVPCSAEAELALREAAKHELITYIPGEGSFEMRAEDKLNEKQKKALQFIKENLLDKYHSTGIQDVLNAAVFNLLGYMAIHPGGVSKLEDSEGRVIPDCFLMPPKTTALSFAFRLHTDFGNKFICAKDVRTKMTVGKDHPLKHLDIVEIVANR